MGDILIIDYRSEQTVVKRRNRNGCGISQKAFILAIREMKIKTTLDFILPLYECLR